METYKGVPTDGFTRRKLGIGLGLVIIGLVSLVIPPVRRLFHPIIVRFRGVKTIEDRLTEFSAARDRLQASFDRAGVAYPPDHVVLLGLKEERQLEVYAGNSPKSLRRIARHPILAASGTIGPKLREGDRQVPEGIYSVESLNPNSRFHVSLRIAYPNEFDREMARRDRRTNLGSDIMIHGGAASIGCLAMGDVVAEELFVLAAEAGIRNVRVVLSPMDLRTKPLPPGLDAGWQRELYESIRSGIEELR